MEAGRSENFSIKQLRPENVKLLQILIKFMNSQRSYLQKKKIRLEVPDTK
jgi:hypothetical protein